MSARLVQVIGGGPAGSAAALAALQESACVTIHEKSTFPRHKVCGEFLSPGVVPLLSGWGLESAFFREQPAPVRRMRLHLERAAKQASLPETAWGLSRYAFDRLLLGHAAALGAGVRRERVEDVPSPVVIATGRRSSAALKRGDRLFGFKAHFEGPVEDAVELYFFRGCYIGISPVEKSTTNVCGLGPEHILKRFQFIIDELLDSVPAVRERLSSLRRRMDWLNTGPLQFSNRFSEAAVEGVYAAGDALSFVDPFTGSGLLSALLSGSIAGRCAANSIPSGEARRQCRTALAKPFAVAGLVRSAIASGWANRLLPVVPSSLLFRLTRP